MSTIKPFKAVYYNLDKVKEIAKVVSPPYDVISPKEQIDFHNLSPYNFTHIDFGADKPNDNSTNNKYTRAKSIFEDWLSKKVMLEDTKPSIYFYKQEFKMWGGQQSRLGFVALMKLPDENVSRIFPHENTHSKAIDDRLKLTKTLDSNLSSIFVCYSDKQKKVEKIFMKHALSQKPLLEVEDRDNIRHKVWRLDDPGLIEEINSSLHNEHLFIADGHHRYQVALEFRRFKTNQKVKSTGEEPFNYVMTYFTNIDSRDLLILPMHRIVKHFPVHFESLEENFRMDKMRNKDEIVIPLAKAGVNEHAFGLYTRDGIRLLRLKNKSLIDQVVKEGSHDYKALDATILKYFVFDPLGIKSEDIIYTKDFNEVTDMVDNHQADAGFVMNPVKISQLKAIALNGERMPPKTTYFYPKVLSGLTVYKME